MDMQPLALVTGAGHRLGRAFAQVLASNGYAVLLHYQASQVEAERTADELQKMGVPVQLSQADLREPREVARLFAEADRIPYPLKVLVNSAAINPVADARTMPVEEWDAVMDLNLRAPFLCAQEAARRMAHGGLIVNVSDVGASKTWTRYPAYSVSKAGLESLTRILARALAPTIRVNAIAPGLVLQSEDLSDEEWARLVARLPLKRPATTQEIASALEFLLKNEYVTGQTLAIDGGYTLLG